MKILSLLAAGLAASTCLVVSRGTSDATLGVLGCLVTPSQGSQSFTKTCSPDVVASSYDVVFEVLKSGSTSYAWTVPAPWSSHIVSGCQSNTSSCTVTASGQDSFTVSVTLFPGQTTGSATAILDACGSSYC
jgi:hypothetical protein